MLKNGESHKHQDTRQDTAEQKRIELHLHTKESVDGIIDVKDLIGQVAEWGHPAVAITDHGRIDAFAEAYKAGAKHQIKVIYGLEVDVVDDEVPIVTCVQERDLLHDEYVIFDVETTGCATRCHITI
jgi:DNA polymerase-3 subunit alpha (Gram-positive type)